MSLQIIEWPLLLKSGNGGDQGADFSLSAMTIGVFDGLHLGHKALIDRICSRGPNPTVVTFRENPKKFFSPEKFKGDISSLKQKLKNLEKMGVSRLILIDFSLEFSKLNGRDFLSILAERGKMAFLAVGSNFRCGFRQDTDAERIAAINEGKGIPTEVFSPVALQSEPGSGPVNSSRIRSAIISGDIKTASALMGRNFELDVSDIEKEGQVYDLRSANRVIPEGGEHPVLVVPGGMKAVAIIQNGKLRLEPGLQAESLEFI